MKIKYITTLFILLISYGCTYDYQYPDISDLEYHLEVDISYDLRHQLWNECSEYETEKYPGVELEKNYSFTYECKYYDEDKQPIHEVKGKVKGVAYIDVTYTVYDVLLDKEIPVCTIKFDRKAIDEINHKSSYAKVISLTAVDTYTILPPPPTKKEYTIIDNGFDNKCKSLLVEYGCSTYFGDRRRSIIEYDGDGNVLAKIGYIPIEGGDSNVSAEGCEYIMVEMEMNNGQFGYLRTDKIPLSIMPSTIILSDETNVNVVLNVPESS